MATAALIVSLDKGRRMSRPRGRRESVMGGKGGRAIGRAASVKWHECALAWRAWRVRGASRTGMERGRQ